MTLWKNIGKKASIILLAVLQFTSQDIDINYVKKQLKQEENRRLVEMFDGSSLNLSAKEKPRDNTLAELEKSLKKYSPNTQFGPPYFDSNIKTDVYGLDRDGIILRNALNANLPGQFKLSTEAILDLGYDGSSRLSDLNFELTRNIRGTRAQYKLNLDQDRELEYKLLVNFDF